MRHLSRTSRRGRSNSSDTPPGFHRPGVIEQLEARKLLSGSDLDTAFGGDGYAALVPNVAFTAVATQADGKIVVAGPSNDSEANFVVARFNTNGTLDTTFGYGDGVTNVDFRDYDNPTAIAITTQGKIVIGGYSTSSFDVGTDFSIARLNANGSPDNSFSGDGKLTWHVGTTDDRLTDIALQADGKIVVTGSNGRAIVGRINVNGTIDNGFGGSGVGYIALSETGSTLSASSVKLLDGGRIAVLGTAVRPGNALSGIDTRIYLTSLNSNGTRSSTPLGTRFYDIAPFYAGRDEPISSIEGGFTTDLVVLPSGNLAFGAYVQYFNSSFDVIDSSLIVKVNANGNVLDSVEQDIDINSYYDGTTTRVNALALADGYLVAGGHTAFGELLLFHHRADTLGAAQQYKYSRGAPNSARGNGLAVGPEGRIYLAGLQTYAVFNPETGTGTEAGGSALIGVIGFGGAPDADDQLTEAIPLQTDGFVNGAIDGTRDVDMFSFTVVAGQTVSFDIDNNGSPLDGYLRLFNATGTQLASNDNAAAPGEQLHISPYLSYRFQSAGKYYVAVSGRENASYNPINGNGDTAGSTGGYSLTTIASDTNDRISTATSAPLNSTRVNQSIANVTDVDVFKFTVSAGQRVGFDVDTLGSPLDGYMRLFNANGTQLAANDNGIAPGEQIAKSPYLSYTFANAGTYYVAISGKGNQSYSVNTGMGDMQGSVGEYVLDLRLL